MKNRHAAIHAPAAFTIIELLITLTIFSMVAILCVNTLVNATASARKIQAQATLYSEMQNLMDQLAGSIEQNTVDYEAYYLRNVQGETGWNFADNDNYGYYAQSFYNPGDGGPLSAGPYPSIHNYGISCDDGSIYPDGCPTETPDSADADLDTGAHPFTGISSVDSSYDDDPASMNAFCEPANGSVDCGDFRNGVSNELILINSAGDERTVFVLQPFGGTSLDNHLATVKLAGTDMNNDGIVDTWLCTSKFPCGEPPATFPTIDDFMPITPDILNIEKFYVYVTPMEDPYRGFASGEDQVQPSVTIVMTATLSDDYSGRMLGDVPNLTIQRTVSTGVYSKVVSY